MRISDWSSDVCSSDLFASLWSTEVDELRDQTRVETIYLVTGLLLPVWGKLPGDHVQVWRLTTEDGQSLLGRLVPAPLVPKIATAFGVAAAIRSEGRRVGKECVGTCRSRWSACR